MRNNLLLNILVIIIVMGSLFGCAADSGKIYTKNDREYGRVQGVFRHKWWNYYERGLSYADGDFHREALADLKEAARKRGKDQRMARTYGMHFVDYFPHRELGVVYYSMGNLNTAKAELELSISQFPSAKARFYLDRIRKALIEQQAGEVFPPELTLGFKSDEVWTSKDPVIISGTVEDKHYISGIDINKAPLFMESSQKSVSFSEPVQLSQGRHVIEVRARNLSGKVAKQQVVIHVDRQGPMITLNEPGFDMDDPGRKVTISGSLYDESGVSSFTINGRSIHIKKGLEVFFTENLIMGNNSFQLVAKDRLGNQTSADISLGNALAFAVQSTIDNQQSTIPILLASASSDMTGIMMAGLFDPRDTSPPDISLKGCTDTQTVYLEKVYIEGQITDEGGIESVTINQKPILRRKGKSIFLSHMAELRKGENKIVIEARDEAGNATIREISIIRQVPRALQLEERLSLTVLPFEQKASISEASLSFQDNLINALVNQNRFRVVEREKIDMILQEQKLGRTKLIDKSTALKLGRLIAAQSIITGSIIETGTGIEIVARMIDTETSEILAVEDVYDEVKDLPALRSLAQGMAVKFHRDFPLSDGLIIRQKGKYIFTDLGQDKIRIQRRLIIYREEPITHPVTGKIFGADNMILGRARVTQVMPDMSKAQILTGKTGLIKSLDKVITE